MAALKTARYGLFTASGTYVAPADDLNPPGDLLRLARIWGHSGHTLRRRSIVYVRGDLKLCAGCRGKRNKTKFDVKPASDKETTFCRKCGRCIHKEGTGDAN